MCYSRLIRICNQYGIDLNSLFFADQPQQTKEKNYVSIPIIYIDDYLEYYLSIEEKPLKFKQIYCPKPVCFDCIIQLYHAIGEHNATNLIYAFCKKVARTTRIEVGRNYVLLLANKGFYHYEVVEINQEEQILYVSNEMNERKAFKVSDVIEVFQCINYLPC